VWRWLSAEKRIFQVAEPAKEVEAGKEPLLELLCCSFWRSCLIFEYIPHRCHLTTLGNIPIFGSWEWIWRLLTRTISAALCWLQKTNRLKYYKLENYLFVMSRVSQWSHKGNVELTVFSNESVLWMRNARHKEWAQVHVLREWPPFARPWTPS